MRLHIRAMPRHAHATLSIVTTGHSRSQNGVLRTPMPVVHAEFEQANARWEALCKRKFCMDCRIKSGNDEWNERERTKKIRRRKADRRNWLSPAPYGPGRAPIGGRPSIGVPPRLWLRRPNATTQLQFRATRDEAAVGLSPELASLGTAMLLADPA